jgi:hypothetical protein
MCLKETTFEVIDSLQRRNLIKTEPITLSRGESRGRAKNISQTAEYDAEKGNRLKQEESFLNTIVLTKKEKPVLNVEQDPREVWYFAHI